MHIVLCPHCHVNTLMKFCILLRQLICWYVKQERLLVLVGMEHHID